MPEPGPSTPRYRPPERVPRLAELTWPEAARRIRRDPRLIVPVGTCLQHGPHLPLDTDIRIVTAVGEGIAARYRVLLAPTLPFGTVSEREVEYAGTAGLRSKTLHRVVNELLASWEGHGVTEFVLLTSQGYAPHFGVLVTALAERARVRAVDLNAVDISGFRSGPPVPEHGGELDTSLLLYFAPSLVRMGEAVDQPLDPEEMESLLQGSEPMPPLGSVGVVGSPSRASAEKGRHVYEHLVEHIGRRLFGEPSEEVEEDAAIVEGEGA